MVVWIPPLLPYYDGFDAGRRTLSDHVAEVLESGKAIDFEIIFAVQD
jgi:hypothetical protein